MQPTLEQVTFRIQEGISDADFLTASENIGVWVKKQPGFSYRTLVRKSDGQWSDLVYWSSEEAAKSASEKFMQAEELKEFMTMIKPESVKMEHMSMLQVTNPD